MKGGGLMPLGKVPEKQDPQKAVLEMITEVQTLQQNLVIISQREFSKTRRQRRQNHSRNLTS